MEIEIENHRQERDKHMEGETKRKDMAKSEEMQTVLDNYIWSDIVVKTHKLRSKCMGDMTTTYLCDLG